MVIQGHVILCKKVQKPTTKFDFDGDQKKCPHKDLCKLGFLLGSLELNICNVMTLVTLGHFLIPKKVFVPIKLVLAYCFFLFFQNSKKCKSMQNIFFWEKTFYTKKKTHVFPNFSQRVMQNSENFPPEIFFPLCNSWGPHHGNEPQASRTCWER